MNFCSNCGAPATGTAYCGNCGQPMTGEATAAAGQRTGAQQAGARQAAPPGPSGSGPGGPAVQAGPLRANPFADIPVLDYVRDVIALVLLLISFGLPWDLEDSATGKVYVLLVTLLSVISLALPYLKRGGVLPAAWGTAELRLARLAANAPYVVVVLITLVLGYVGENDGDGVGVGIAFGLAGALLAAQGRQAEQVPDGAGDGALWRWITVGLGGLFALLTIISMIMFLVDEAEFLDWELVTYQILVMLFFLALAVLPTVGAIRGDAAWRDVLVLLGVVALFVGVWQLSAEETMADAWSLSASGPQLILVPALAAAVSAAGMRALVRPVAGAAHWVAVSARLFQVAMLVATAGVVLYALQIVAVDDGRGTVIVVLVLHLILLVAAVVGRNALSRDPNLGRAVAVTSAAVFLLLGIVIASILGASDRGFVDVADATIVSVLWWFAVALIVALTAPPSVRREYGPVAAGQVGFGGSSASSSTSAGTAAAADVPASPAVPQPQEPAVPSGAGRTSTDAAREEPAGDAAATAGGPDTGESADEPEPVEGLAVTDEPASADQTETRVNPPAAENVETRVDQRAVTDDAEAAESSGFDARTASDPNTPLQVLADIAAQEPSLRKYVAANPSTYPELLTWLGELGDPDVDEALRRRQ